jgi:hypothetical protein
MVSPILSFTVGSAVYGRPCSSLKATWIIPVIAGSSWIDGIAEEDDWIRFGTDVYKIFLGYTGKWWKGSKDYCVKDYLNDLY